MYLVQRVNVMLIVHCTMSMTFTRFRRPLPRAPCAADRENNWSTRNNVMARTVCIELLIFNLSVSIPQIPRNKDGEQSLFAHVRRTIHLKIRTPVVRQSPAHDQQCHPFVLWSFLPSSWPRSRRSVPLEPLVSMALCRKGNDKTLAVHLRDFNNIFARTIRGCFRAHVSVPPQFTCFQISRRWTGGRPPSYTKCIRDRSRTVTAMAQVTWKVRYTLLYDYFQGSDVCAVNTTVMCIRLCAKNYQIRTKKDKICRW